MEQTRDITWEGKKRESVNLELDEICTCHSSTTIPTVEMLRGSFCPLRSAKSVVLPRPYEKMFNSEEIHYGSKLRRTSGHDTNLFFSFYIVLFSYKIMRSIGYPNSEMC